MLFLSNTFFLSKRRSHPRCSIKKTAPTIPRNPQENTYVTASLLIKKWLPHMCSPVNSMKPWRTSPQQNTSGGCFRSNIYIKYYRSATWVRKKNNSIPNYVDLCCFHVIRLVISLCLYQRPLSGPFRDLFQWFLARFCIHI